MENRRKNRYQKRIDTYKKVKDDIYKYWMNEIKSHSKTKKKLKVILGFAIGQLITLTYMFIKYL